MTAVQNGSLACSANSLCSVHCPSDILLLSTVDPTYISHRTERKSGYPHREKDIVISKYVQGWGDGRPCHRIPLCSGHSWVSRRLPLSEKCLIQHTWRDSEAQMWRNTIERSKLFGRKQGTYVLWRSLGLRLRPLLEVSNKTTRCPDILSKFMLASRGLVASLQMRWHTLTVNGSI
jgi:hypothetical protein